MERMLFVGSCFADNIGRLFQRDRFRAVVNPYGVMYNPVSIRHTIKRLLASGDTVFRPDEPGVCVLTLGTNHVYILKETGEIVDNCQKRPQKLFEERELTVAQCADTLRAAVCMISDRYPLVNFIVTVSPIRYRKYGFHGSRLSKATLLLAVDQMVKSLTTGNKAGMPKVAYFPAYEIMDDELRDYRFYQPDMMHPTEQAAEYIHERLAEAFFSDATRQFINEWTPVRKALEHRPLNPDSESYKQFKRQTAERLEALKQRWNATFDDL